MLTGEGVILESGEYAVVKRIHNESVIYIISNGPTYVLKEGTINDKVKRFQSIAYKMIPVLCIPLTFKLTKKYGYYEERAEGYKNSPMEIHSLQVFGEESKFQLYFALLTHNRDVIVHYKEIELIFPKVYQCPIYQPGQKLKAKKNDTPTGIQRNRIYEVIDSNFEASETNDIVYLKDVENDERTYSYIKFFKTYEPIT